MKTFILFVITILTFTFLGSAAYASEGNSRKFDYKDFNYVEVSSGMHLTVSQSDSYSIEVKASDEDFKYLKVEKDGNTLKFYFKKDFWSFGWTKHHRIDVNIKMPALTGTGLSGGSVANINMDVSSKKFTADLSGGSSLNGNLKCANIQLELSGGSTVEISGAGKNLRVEGSGGSIFNMKNFSVGNVDADLSGGSQVSITMSGNLNTSQSGGSHLTYYGSANLSETDFSGGSGVSKGK